MVKVISGSLLAKGKKFAIVASRFNEFITAKLIEGAIDTLTRHEVLDNDISLVWVPGSFEIPTVVSKLLKSKKFDAVICLGTLIRGSTSHFEYIASQLSRGISQLSVDSGIPVIFGVITADTIEQSIERAGTKEGNRGRDAAVSAIEMVNVTEKI
ncbi:MAG: 6,7-dimethyl-8-ribityllumazine synthase [Candidatus Omnitrophica bacterium]|nr:6,7-dimethyl-8-ribityllumazine synthase [Candidatus Omnitrophota bacterium]